MKKLLIIPILFLAFVARAQNATVFCVQAICPITVTLPVDSALLISAAASAGDTVTGYSWRQISGPTATLATPLAVQSWAKGLNTAGVYTYSVTVTTKHGSVSSANTSITVLQAAATPRTVTSIQIVIDGILINIPLTGSKVTYSDGSVIQN